jgi:hypothetical protein
MVKYLPVILLLKKKKFYKEIKNYYLFWLSGDSREEIRCLYLKPQARELTLAL